MIPTVGFNMKKVTKGNVSIKVSWRYIKVDGTVVGHRRPAALSKHVGALLPRSQCHCVRYFGVALMCRYMLDAADLAKMDAAKEELLNLLSKPHLAGIPVRATMSPLLMGRFLCLGTRAISLAQQVWRCLLRLCKLHVESPS